MNNIPVSKRFKNISRQVNIQKCSQLNSEHLKSQQVNIQKCSQHNSEHLKSQSARPRKWISNERWADRTRDLQIFSLTLSQLSDPRLYAQSWHKSTKTKQFNHTRTHTHRPRRGCRGAGSGEGGPPPHPPQLRLRPRVLRRRGHPNPCGNGRQPRRMHSYVAHELGFIRAGMKRNSPKTFPTVLVTSNLQTHVWSIKYNWKNNQLHSLTNYHEMNFLRLINSWLYIICQVTTKCAIIIKPKLFHQLNAPCTRRRIWQL